MQRCVSVAMASLLAAVLLLLAGLGSRPCYRVGTLSLTSGTELRWSGAPVHHQQAGVRVRRPSGGPLQAVLAPLHRPPPRPPAVQTSAATGPSLGFL